jgi:hypothetical protein
MRSPLFSPRVPEPPFRCCPTRHLEVYCTVPRSADCEDAAAVGRVGSRRVTWGYLAARFDAS